MARPVSAEINLSALKHNLSLTKSLAPNSKIWAVIKANGYGHGFERVARALSSADGFAVASVEEAIELRSLGLQNRILLLEGVFQPEELSKVVELDLDFVIHNEQQVQDLLAFAPQQNLRVWLKLDSGMHRLGFAPEALEQAKKLLEKQLPNLELNLISHFSSADNDFIKTQAQLDVFNEVLTLEFKEASLANSAGIQLHSASHKDWVRPGIMLYGAGICGSVNGFQPVMTLKTKLIDLKWIDAQVGVGYDSTWVSQRKSLIGIAAVGYGDGYPRHAPNGTPVLVKGKEVPLVGRVSMDMLSLDLTDLADEVALGDEVILWGRGGLSVDRVAQLSQTIGYELLCGITKRVAVEEL